MITIHRLLVNASMSTDNHDYHYSGSRGYQQRFSVSTRSHLFPSSGDGVKQGRDGYTGRRIERDASQGEQGVGGERFFLGVRSTLLPHAMIVPSRWVLLWDVSNLRVSNNTEILVRCVLPATVSLDLSIRIVQVTL